jgi:tetratricopeptide (TPR) repeat protein
MKTRRAGVTMSEVMMNHTEQLRQAALEHVRQGDLDEAIVLYDEALSVVADDEARELITINKADAMIALERSGPEVQELARIIMRRRNLRHVYLAAYALQYKHRLENDFKRALFYGQLALRTADEASEPAWRRVVLIDLGNVYEMDSQIDQAIECFREALEISGESNENHDQDLSYGYALENLGYCMLLQQKIEEGIETIQRALAILHDPIGAAEAHIDLCYGYLEQNDLDKALEHGTAGLDLAKDPRQIRNSHYLLGEVAYKLGDVETADFHFDQLARFYPEFRNLKSLLFAIDLRGMVNLKL